MSCPRAAGNSNKGAQSAHKNASNKNKGGVLGRAHIRPKGEYTWSNLRLLYIWCSTTRCHVVASWNLGSPERRGPEEP